MRPNFHRSSRSQTGLSKKLSSTASVKGTSTPLAKYRAPVITAIDARGSIQENLANGSEDGMQSSFEMLACFHRTQSLQVARSQPFQFAFPDGCAGEVACSLFFSVGAMALSFPRVPRASTFATTFFSSSLNLAESAPKVT